MNLPIIASKVDVNLNEEIVSYAVSKYPNESCGLIVETENGLEFVECENIAKDATKNFVIDDFVMLKHSTNLFSIFHSHVEDGVHAVSLADIDTCRNWNVPGSIVFLSKSDRSSRSDVLFYGKDVVYSKLIGRNYYYNVFDCFTLIKDYYYTAFNFKFPAIRSEYGWWECTEGDDSLFVVNIAKFGFKEFDLRCQLEVGDILIMEFGNTYCANHGAIYTGNGNIMHHMIGRLSVEECLDKYSSKIKRGIRRA